MTTPDWTVHDDPDGHDRDAAGVVDQGLGDFNEAAAPLHQVQPLACYARDAQGTVIGGAVGRTWGSCVELQQLWVDAARRRQGLGAQLLLRFEALAIQRGCRLAYLDTFSFQAPSLYARLGYVKVSTIAGFAPGIEKYGMQKVLA
ncbi:GNAT family N-acetyltransferase [uncultured Methylibium sp.]|uniref:GNAT family N-acetyltransferase n=1 Tax=uncultured Methylibium sp. TaxID=381093 RepID=UPI0025D83AD9|nr:GNAT family N-acetyltransferase [uncultured Methylibium sp.]